MTTEDSQDFSFAPTEATNDSMVIPKGYSYILMNQADLTAANRQKLTNLEDSTLAIGMGALSGTVLSAAACIATSLALTVF